MLWIWRYVFKIYSLELYFKMHDLEHVFLRNGIEDLNFYMGGAKYSYLCGGGV